MTVQGLSIGGLRVPSELSNIMESGRWLPPEGQVLREVFGDEPDDPHFYDFGSMVRQNDLFRAMAPEDYVELVGVGGLHVDRSGCVLIGDLGADMPIALDYRSNQSDPRVIYLGLGGWREVAPSFGVLAERLRL